MQGQRDGFNQHFSKPCYTNRMEATAVEQETHIISPEKDKNAIEQAKCGLSPGYFVDTYLQIDDPNKGGSEWFPFKLWPAQKQLIQQVANNDKVIVLKARQLGITWMMLAYALWLMVYKPGSMILLFSKTSDDARELMRRLSGMWERLPEWTRPVAEKQLEQQLVLANGSRAKSFTTTKHSGRSFTATFVLIDEAAFIPFLSQLLNAAEETADEGGKLAVISTNDKEKPNNGFAKLYRRSRDGASDFKNYFLAWYTRPTRTQDWYRHKEKTKELDDLWQEYPETPQQALAGQRSNKRFTAEMIINATLEGARLNKWGRSKLPKIPGVVYWAEVIPDRKYLIIIDPAEGDATSDPSSILVMDAILWEEVGYAEGQWEPSQAARYGYSLGNAFNKAEIAVERNNHGHSVILALNEIYQYKNIYRSPFDKKRGWHTNVKTKTLAYDKLAEYMETSVIGFRSKEILAQIANIDSDTQEAPEGDHDDAAMCASIASAVFTWPTQGHKRNKNRRRFTSVTL